MACNGCKESFEKLLKDNHVALTSSVMEKIFLERNELNGKTSRSFLKDVSEQCQKMDRENKKLDKLSNSSSF